MIPRDQLVAYLDDALDPKERATLDRALETDEAALRFVLEQRTLERALHSVLLPTPRRQRLKESILAALAGRPAHELKAKVLAELVGERLGSQDHPLPVPLDRSEGPHLPNGGVRGWFSGFWRRVLTPGTAVRAWARPLAAAATVALFLVAGFWITEAVRSSRLGTEIGVVTEAVGQPSLRQDPRPTPIHAARGTPVRLGDRFETGDADRVEIRFRDGTTLRLAFNTLVELPKVEREPGTATNALLRPPEVRLLKGQVWTQVAKRTHPPAYAIRTDAATAVARGTEFGVRLQRLAPTPPPAPSAPGSSPFSAVLTVKEGAVDFFNAHGSVQATAMTESTARPDSAPTEPRRLDTLQTVALPSGATWSLLTSPLDASEAATRLAVGGGTLGWDLVDRPGPNGVPEVRLARLASTSPAARAGLRVGDTVTALDGRPLTKAWELATAVLLRPEGPLPLRVRRASGDEGSVALQVAAAIAPLPGPTLSAADRTALQDLLRRWLSEPPNPTPDAAAESRRFEQAAALSRLPAIRAAAFNQLGVAYELADALGPAIRAYGRACYLQPEVPLFRFNLALALRTIGSFERALDELREGARLRPDSVPVRLRLAEVISLLGRHEEALARTTVLLQEVPEDPATLKLQAQLLLKLRRPADAVSPARRAAELDPECPVAHAYLAEALHDAGRLEEALAAATEAIDRAPFEAAFLVNLGTLQRDLEQPDAAERTFRQAIALDPGFSLAQRNLGESLAARRDFAAAGEALNWACTLDPHDPVAHWRLGDMLLEQRRFEQAERAYRHALDLAPNRAEAWYGLGEVHRLRNRSADAEQAYRRAIELQSDDAAAHTALGIVFHDRGDLDEAERLYHRALQLNPNRSAPCHNLGNLHREGRGDLDAAEHWYRRALELDPEEGESLGGLGLVAEQRGDLPEAERLLRRAIELTPDASGLHNNLGEILRKRGRLDEAETHYRRALELAPDNPAPYGNLGVLQAGRKQFAEAEWTFRTLLARSIGQARLPALVNLAQVCAEQGHLEEAERLLRQARELAPQHPRAAQALASFLADHRTDLDEALALATRAVRSAPNDAGFLDTLGWVQARRGDLDAAERTLHRALALAGEEPPAAEIRRHLEQTRARRLPSETNHPAPKP